MIQLDKLKLDGEIEMNIDFILMSEDDIVEFKGNIQYAFQKGLKMCSVNVKKRFFLKRISTNP